MVEVGRQYGSFKKHLNPSLLRSIFVEKLRGYSVFQWVYERNVYGFPKEIGSNHKIRLAFLKSFKLSHGNCILPKISLKRGKEMKKLVRISKSVLLALTLTMATLMASMPVTFAHTPPISVPTYAYVMV